MNKTTLMGGCIIATIALSSLVQAQDWYGEVTGLYWKRNTNRNSFDFFESGSNSLNPSRDLPFDHEFGDRVRIAYDSYVWEIEGLFTRIDDWAALRTDIYVTDDLSFDLNPASTGTPLSFVNAISQAAVQEEESVGPGRINSGEHLDSGFRYNTDYRSSWDDIELNFNYVPPHTTWFKLGVGARYGNLDELFRLDIEGGNFDDMPLGGNLTEELRHDSLTNVGSEPANVNDNVVGGGLTLISGGADGFRGDVIGGAAAAGSVLDIDFESDVDNQLVGAQVAVHGVFFENDYVLLEASLKTGAYLNHVNVILTETYVEQNRERSTYQKIHRDEKDAVAFLGNAGLTGGYKLRENIRVKAGYEVMFMSGVALATDQWHAVQADNAGPTRLDLDASGSIFVHGGNASLEVIW